MSLEPRRARTFLAVAEPRASGAARLNVAQPALSRTIRQLEALTNLRLFERTTRTVRLTAAAVDGVPVRVRGAWSHW